MKTIRQYTAGVGGRENHALIELDQNDLSLIGALAYGSYGSAEVKGDPAKLLSAIVARDRQALARTINEHGPAEIVKSTLVKLDEWLSNGRKVAATDAETSVAASAGMTGAAIERG